MHLTDARGSIVPPSHRVASGATECRARQRKGPSAQECGFATIDGRPKHRSTITHEGLRPALTAAKLPTVGLHSFRHTFASTLLMAGRTAPEVAKLCGHSGSDVTDRVYAHWLKGDQHAEALAALGGDSVVASGSIPT